MVYPVVYFFKLPTYTFLFYIFSVHHRRYLTLQCRVLAYTHASRPS